MPATNLTGVSAEHVSGSRKEIGVEGVCLTMSQFMLAPRDRTATLLGRVTLARVGQIALGLIWIVDGLLKLQPYFFTHFVTGVIDPNAAGQPGVIAHPITWIGDLLRTHQVIFVLLIVIGEVAIGAGLLFRRTVKPALLVSFVWALNVWLTGEGLGFLFTGMTPDPMTGILGAAPMYIVAGALVWPSAGDAEPRFGLLGQRTARLMWAALWLAAAALWLFPANAGRDAASSMFAGAPSGAGWLSSLHSAAAGFVSGAGMTIAVMAAVVSAEIGLCVLWGRGTRFALIAGMAVSIVFWLLAEGLGGLFTGQATDVGTGPLMILIAWLLLPLAAGDASPSPAALRMAPAGAIRR